jgi:sensor histidine kinase YesM
MRYPQLYKLAFSSQSPYRWGRHLLFCFAVILYHVLRIGLMYPLENIWSDMPSLLGISLYRALLITMLFSYIIVYFLVPRFYMKKKYIWFGVGVLLAFALSQFVSVIYKVFELNQTAFQVIGNVKSLRAGYIRGFGNPPLICGLLLSLKTLKNWHLEQLKTETLAMENASAEIQLLKAQVHPHFLFNTLNNIYAFTLNNKPYAGLLVQKLSGMLNYMVHECDEKLVPIEKEIKLVLDYMDLEKVRYGERLSMQVAITGDLHQKMIAPLLMIPFVENSFKHGTSQIIGHPWIKMFISVKQHTLRFELENSKPSVTASARETKGIGLNNVQKRLQLIYNGRHRLFINETEEAYRVWLEVDLEESTEQMERIPGDRPVMNYEYARI